MNPPAELTRHAARIEAAIGLYLPPAETRPGRLHAAMRYAMQGGGKRLRPVLTLAAAELFDPEGRLDPLPAAVAVESVHTYSLIHDDLPCMDDDDLRRGRATVHKAFDEATALLAGDALLTFAFELLAAHYSGGLAASLVGELAGAAGSRRLIAGQAEDLLAEKRADSSAEDLDFIHLNKTAAMIEASLVIGGRIGGMPAEHLGALRRAGLSLGLAFQIIDDILDATSDSATLGKTAGKDLKAGKATFVGIHGLEKSRLLAREASDAALREFRSLPGRTSFLVELTGSMAQRSR